MTLASHGARAGPRERALVPAGSEPCERDVSEASDEHGGPSAARRGTQGGPAEQA